MIVYKVFCKDYGFKKDDLIGVLAERRNDLRGETHFESGMKWARVFFSSLVKDKQGIFVVPKDLEVGE